MADPSPTACERVRLFHGDSRDILRGLADESIDSVVTDPPYALVSIVKRFGKAGAAAAKGDVYARASAGFMGKAWDTGEVAFDPAFWSEVLRVLKPGGHVLAFGGTRSYHRLACAIEDAGFEVRDQIGWLYGSGFPKSHDVSKGIDKAAGAVREVVGQGPYESRKPRPYQGGNALNISIKDDRIGHAVTAPATEAARQWEGWGTALKPAWEPIVLARKPLIGTVVENVLTHGTGALNIDGCRVHADDAQGGSYTVKRLKPGATLDKTGGNWRPEEGPEYHGEMKPGRWPANVIHDGSDEVLAAFPDAPGQQGRLTGDEERRASVYGKYAGVSAHEPRNDTGSAARFFYSAKADADDRAASKHPTVKPVDLMAYLVRLVTPKGGVVLDPFAGSGTTGEACIREGMHAVLIDREVEYVSDIQRRIALAMAGPEERARELVKVRGQVEALDALPLFGFAK